ncbi:MAG TPA: uroporphyrinogen decarboxylase [Candidatus Limnocylindrales bacterium]|nr:uroporphyrinogen decarboxylase [Candidatus Limnocylindrales bacterium]
MTGADRLLAACRGRPVDATPVWFMRQSGGSLPSYLAIRKRHSVLDIAHSPALCAEVTLGAADALGTDAAVMFADVLLPVEAMGVDLELSVTGPILERPIRSREDVARLRRVDVEADLGFTLDAIRRVRAGIGDRAAVIGIAGGPFTLAAYLIEGGPSRDHLAAKRVAFGAPDLWADLLDRLTDLSVDYVRAQAAAGAQVIQVFDSWAGTLGPADYDRLVAPWTARILAAVRDADVPTIQFAAAGSALLERLAVGADVVSVDGGQSLAVARSRLGPSVALQGNLDPARLLAGWPAVAAGVEEVLAAAGSPRGHVFNTGHAVPRETDPAILRDAVTFVHERTARTLEFAEARR